MAFTSKKRLTFKQLKFIEAYIGEAQFNCAEAARLAGYSPKSNQPTRLLDVPQIEAEIRRRCLKIRPKFGMTREDIIGSIERIVFDTRPPARGGPTPMARLRGARELGLIHGLYTNKIQVTGSLTLIDLLLGASVTQLPDNRPGVPANAAPQLLEASAGAGPVTSTAPVYELAPEEEPMYG